MKISELIEALNRMPGDGIVVYDDTKRGLVPAKRAELTAGYIDGTEFISGPRSMEASADATVTLAVVFD